MGEALNSFYSPIDIYCMRNLGRALRVLVIRRVALNRVPRHFYRRLLTMKTRRSESSDVSFAQYISSLVARLVNVLSTSNFLEQNGRVSGTLMHHTNGTKLLTRSLRCRL